MFIFDDEWEQLNLKGFLSLATLHKKNPKQTTGLFSQHLIHYGSIIYRRKSYFIKYRLWMIRILW